MMRIDEDKFLLDGLRLLLLPFVILFKTVVAKRPDRIAIQDVRRQFSYQELDHLSNRFATRDARKRGQRQVTSLAFAASEMPFIWQRYWVCLSSARLFFRLEPELLLQSGSA